MMKLTRLASFVKEHGIRSGSVLTADRLLGRKAAGVSYEQWLSRSHPSSRDYQKMEKEHPKRTPVIGVSALMNREDRVSFFQSLQMQIYRNFGAWKNCPQAEYLLMVHGACTLRPELMWECADLLSGVDSVADSPVLVYFDSDTIGDDGRKCEPAFRPEFDPDLLERVNYMGNVVLVRADAAREAVLPAGGEEAFHRFLIRVCLGRGEAPAAGRTDSVRHIPKVLYHTAAGSSVEALAGAGSPVPDDRQEQTPVMDAPALEGRLSEQDPARGHSPDAEGRPLVSVLIPNRDHADDLARCVDSLLQVNTWENLEILILENNSGDDETLALYKRLQERDGRIRVLRWDRPFNYSAINNFGASAAKGEYLLLLNNDTRILEPESIARMQELAQKPETGAVGALLLYPDTRVQHGGIILGHGGIAGHAWEGERPMETADPFPKLVFSHTHNVSAVTGACLMIRRSVWERAGGMDQALKVTFNDVDLCMRLRREGLRVLMCPDACLIHDESASRGSEDTKEKVERFHTEIRIFVHRWERELEEGDPFYNPNLTLTGKSWMCRDELREERKPYLKYLRL